WPQVSEHPGVWILTGYFELNDLRFAAEDPDGFIRVYTEAAAEGGQSRLEARKELRKIADLVHEKPGTAEAILTAERLMREDFRRVSEEIHGPPVKPTRRGLETILRFLKQAPGHAKEWFPRRRP